MKTKDDKFSEEYKVDMLMIDVISRKIEKEKRKRDKIDNTIANLNVALDVYLDKEKKKG